MLIRRRYASGTDHDLSRTPIGRNRRIVGVIAHADVGFFGDGNDAFEQPSQVVPEFFLGLRLCQGWLLVRLCIVELRGDGTATCGHPIGARAARAEVVAQHGNADLAHGLHGGDKVQ